MRWAVFPAFPWVLLLATAAAADQPPVVTAPASLTVHVGSFIQADITASDPDGDPIASLTLAGAEGSNFVPSRDNASGWFSWSPRDRCRPSAAHKWRWSSARQPSQR